MNLRTSFDTLKWHLAGRRQSLVDALSLVDRLPRACKSKTLLAAGALL